jgi:hypothetical protein
MNARASENYLAISRSSITRIIQSLYYSPASRCESADRGRSIVQVNAWTTFSKIKVAISGNALMNENINI